VTLLQCNGEWLITGTGEVPTEDSKYEILEYQELQKESRYFITAAYTISYLQLFYQGLSRFFMWFVSI